MTEYNKIDEPRLVLRAVGHPLYFIKPRQVFKIGRNKGNDLLLSDRTVSRNHAEIQWVGEYPVIADLNSTAGMQVDGKFVSHKELRSMHHIKIGNSKIIAEFASTASDTPTMVMDAVVPDLTDSNDVKMFTNYYDKDLTGFLQTTDQLHQLLIKIETVKKTGTLTITGSLSGQIIFGGGKVKQAYCSPKTGAQALLYICSFGACSYSFTHSVDVQEAPLDLSPTFFINRVRSSNTQRSKRYDKNQQ